MQYFNFARLVHKYTSELKAIILVDGYYDDSGDWVKSGTDETVIYGAVISHKEGKIFRSAGTLTTKDKRLFMLEPIDNALNGSKAVYEGNLYTIEDNVENAKFTGVYAYTLKYVSAFKEERPNYDVTEELEDLEQRLDGVLAASEDMPPDDVTDDLNEHKEDLEQRLDGVL